MTTGIFIIAHAPLASALRECVLHVFPDSSQAVVAFDVLSDQTFDQTVEGAMRCIAQLPDAQRLMLTDVFGATPCNVAQKLVEQQNARLIAGVNLPMLLRAMTYRHEPLDGLVARAMAGGTQGVMQVATVAPQNQARMKNDQDHNDHQQ